jgi:hypothetical protein
MRIDNESSLTPRWIVFGTALVYFALGSVLTAHFMHMKEAWADSHRVFKLKIHHAVPGKMSLLQERFYRASMLQARHGLAVAGYWVSEDATVVIRRLSSYLPTTIECISGTSSPFTINTGSPSDLPTIVRLNTDSGDSPPRRPLTETEEDHF